MELTNNKLEAAVVTADETLQNQIETISKEKVERVKSFKDFGFKRAGQNLTFLKTTIHCCSKIVLNIMVRY